MSTAFAPSLLRDRFVSRCRAAHSNRKMRKSRSSISARSSCNVLLFFAHAPAEEVSANRCFRVCKEVPSLRQRRRCHRLRRARRHLATQPHTLTLRVRARRRAIATASSLAGKRPRSSHVLPITDGGKRFGLQIVRGSESRTSSRFRLHHRARPVSIRAFSSSGGRTTSITALRTASRRVDVARATPTAARRCARTPPARERGAACRCDESRRRAGSTPRASHEAYRGPALTASSDRRSAGSAGGPANSPCSKLLR